MKLSIDGRELDLQAALERPTLLLVREMKIRTGYGMKSIMDAAENFKGKDGLEILDDPDLTGALIAMIWLARRTDGEQLTFEEAGSFDINSLQLIEEPAPLAGPVELEGPGAPLPKAETPEAVTVSEAAAESLPAAEPPAAPASLT